MATTPTTISLSVEDVRNELAKIMREAQAVPGRNEVTDVRGARSGAAYDFHNEVQWALNRAANSAQALMQHLSDLDAAVRAAIEAISGQDLSGETTFAELNGIAPSTPTSTTPSTPTGTTPSPSPSPGPNKTGF